MKAKLPKGNGIGATAFYIKNDQFWGITDLMTIQQLTNYLNRMKTTTKALLSCLLVLSTITVQAQESNIILFTENGERFTAILNGLRQNEKPETNVKITGLNANAYKLKVIFADAALGQFNENLYLEPGNETTFVIKKNKKNEYVVQIFLHYTECGCKPRQ